MRRSILSLSVLTLLLIGCILVSPLAGAEAPKKYKIATIIFQEDQFFRLLEFGMKDAGEKAGAEVLSANSQNKPDKEISIINTYITRKVDAIVISPLSAKGSAIALKRARDAGIKIITVNSNVDGELSLSFIENDQKNLGKQTGVEAAKYITEKLGGKAKVAILAFKSIVPEQSNARTDGFKEALADLPGVKIVAEQDAWLPEMAIKKAGDILTANPELDLIFSANEGGTIGSVMAVKNAGRAGKVAVFGTATCKQTSDFLLSDDKILQAVTGPEAFEMGSLAMNNALKVLKGETVEARVAMIGVTLTRSKPDEVKAFQAKMDELIKSNK